MTSPEGLIASDIGVRTIDDMPLDDIIASIEQVQADKASAMSLNEALHDPRYEMVNTVYDPINGSFVVLAERNPKLPASSAFAEMGYASLSPYTSWTRDERVGELRDKLGIRKYYDMKRADGTVRGALRLVKTPVMAARWFIEPASKSPLDVSIAKFVEKNLFEDLNMPFERVLEDALLMCEYGYMPLEKVYSLDIDGKIVLKKLAPRHPLDIQEWIFDMNGGPNGVIMDATEANGWSSVAIPIEKLVVFTLEQEAGDIRGISLLRSAYKHYYYKDTLYKIDAIQKERHGIGVPIIKLPMGYTEQDKQLAENLGRNLRTNERAHITVPANWEVGFAELKGQPVDCLPSIKHHNDQIMGNILAPFYNDPSATQDSMAMFYKATRYIATTIAGTFNRYVIKPLVDFNYAGGKYPILRARRIGENEDLRAWSFAFRNLVGTNAIIPDDILEEFLRTELDLPPADTATARPAMAPRATEKLVARQDSNVESVPVTQPTQVAQTPGNTTNTAKNVGPPKVGLPRQKGTPPVGNPKRNSGTDRSGG
jgi:hypothetical protein